MNDEAQFLKNVERWELFFPQEAQRLLKLSCPHVQFYTNPGGDLNLVTEAGGRTVYLHSTENPREEAKQWFNSLDLNNIELIIVYGVGLGYCYEAAMDWLHRSEKHSLVFVEDNLEVIHRLLETELGTQILHDKQVWLKFLASDFALLLSLSGDFILKPYIFSASPFNEKYKELIFSALKSKYAFFSNFRAGICIEYSDHGKHFFSNFFRNMFDLPKAYFGDRFFGQFKGVPAIICGAGPSLEKNLSVLETLRDKAIIFAGGTAMNALNSTGFLPHFGVGIDPNPAQFTRLIMNQAFETPFFYKNRLLYDALQMVHGDHLYITGAGGYDISKWFEDKLEMQGVWVSEGHNVVNFSVSLAHEMGCNPIILVGLDLAYTNSKSYAPGVINHPLHDRREFFRTKSHEEDVISQTDIYGQPTLTLWKWVTESLWYTQFIRKHPNVTVINATEGGIGFKEIPNQTLSETAEHFLKSQFDFDGWIWMQTQNSPLPTKVTHEEILKAMEELQESLKNCLECCKTIRHEFEESEKQLKQQGKMPENIISEAGIEALDKMEQEPAYTHILKVFSDNYIDRFNREFNRLLYDESLLTDLEINLKRIGLNAARYKSLRETCKIVLKLFEIVLKEDAENLTGMLLKGERSQPLIVSEKDLGDHAHYRLENGELQIIDADLGIDIKEPFSSKPIEDKYASGKLKNRHYLKDGYLHGPSRFYGPDEQLLSESWYVRGKKQGKTRTWYLKGALHSFESHKNGEKEGLQTYYYPNGQIKTSLNYINGQLHGDVKLFFPNGQLKRELHFVQGKRHGFERIWNEIGTLLIEAEFDADKAVGTARKWYPNGNIAKEVIYEKGSDIAVSREWDEIGQMILTEKRQGIDYFDMVTKQTDKLTEALQQVLTQVTTVVPLMESVIAPEEKKKSENLWTQEIDNLCKGVDALAEINKKLAFETGLDVSNKEEAIWKGPASRREIEKEVDKMTKEMTKEMNAMQSALVNALGMLSKKISQLQAKAAAEKKAAEKAPENLPEKAPEKDPEKTKEKNDEPK